MYVFGSIDVMCLAIGVSHSRPAPPCANGCGANRIAESKNALTHSVMSIQIAVLHLVVIFNVLYRNTLVYTHFVIAHCRKVKNFPRSGDRDRDRDRQRRGTWGNFDDVIRQDKMEV